MDRELLKEVLIEMFKSGEIKVETEIDETFSDDYYIETYVKIGDETVQYYKSSLPSSLYSNDN